MISSNVPWNENRSENIPGGISMRAASQRVLIASIFTLVFAAGFSFAQSDPKLYVKDTATGSGDGSSWANAFTSLQDALAYARSTSFEGDIWVARAVNNGGVYVPDLSGKDRNASFELVRNVRIMGGFAGNETQLNQRDIYNNPTVISGDNYLDDSNPGGTSLNNAYHVVTVPEGCDQNTALDGFLIKDGFADFSGGLKDSGAGMLIRNASPYLYACQFTGNWAQTSGAGVYCSEGSQPRFYQCKFRNNGDATHNGGGLFLLNSTPKLEYCVFYNNEAYYGGAIHSASSTTPRLFGCRFFGNRSNDKGGAIFSINSDIEAYNCIFSGNAATNDGGFLNLLYGKFTGHYCTINSNSAVYGRGGGVCLRDYASGTFYNSILWGNSDSQGTDQSAQIYLGPPSSGAYSILYCHVQGMAIPSTPPGFQDEDGADNKIGTEDDNVQLTAGSPCIDAGDNESAPPDLVDGDNDDDLTEPYQKDIQGYPRFMDDPLTADTGYGPPPLADMGAYEYAPPSCFSTCLSRLYVDKDATGSNDGSSWSNAFTTLGEALEEADNCCGMVKEIWVAEGTYTPGIPFQILQRTDTFGLVDGVTVYGGFDGSETYFTQRQLDSHPTILSGDINGDDTSGQYSDNVYHVVSAQGVKEWAVLDGFYIKDGYADLKQSYRDMGGGMICDNASPIIRNCTFDYNHAETSGGAVYCVNSSTPLFRNCSFTNNNTWKHGAAVFNNSSEPVFVGCSFEYNYLTVAGSHGGAVHNAGCGLELTFISCYFYANHANEAGGAVYNNNSEPSFYNCIFSQNFANTNGGAILNSDSNIKVVNCTLYGNYAYNLTGGIHNTGSSAPEIKNTIIWNNCHGNCSSSLTEDSQVYSVGTSPAITYSRIQGWTGALGGAGNSGEDPKLVLPSMNVFQLGCGSSAIDSGDNSLLPYDSTDLDDDNVYYELLPLDYSGEPRRYNDPAAGDIGSGTPPIVDIGAMESQGLPGNCPTRLYVDGNSFSPGDGTSWSNAFRELTTALAQAAACCGQVQEIWVAKGKYYPDTYLTDRSSSFQLIEDVAIYGGFAGTETDLSQRDIEANETILDGDYKGDDSGYNYTDNAYHVVFSQNVSRSAILDGFTIRSGYADGTGGNRDKGAGILNISSSPTIRNCAIKFNTAPGKTAQGGGVCNLQSSSPLIQDCSFYWNAAGMAGFAVPADWGNGGAIFNQDSEPVIVNCQFSSCYANAGSFIHNVDTGSGLKIINSYFTGGITNMGGIFNNNSSPTIINSLIADITGNKGGGGFYNMNGSAPELINCTIMGNGCKNGSAGVYNLDGSNPILTNCILWNNSVLNYQTSQYEYTYESNIGPATGGTPITSYCCIQSWDGSQGGSHNTGWDPKLTFQYFDSGNLILGDLNSGSSCIDAGTNAAVPADTFDLDDDGNVLESIPLDVAGQGRFEDDIYTADTGGGSPPIIDIGAHEFVYTGPTPTVTETPTVTPAGTQSATFTPTPTDTVSGVLPTDTPTPTETQQAAGTTTPTATPTYSGLANDSAYVGDDIPAVLTAGQVYTVHIEMMNTGTRTWTVPDDDALAPVVNPLDADPAYLASGDQIPQGASRIFELTLRPGPEDVPGVTQEWSMSSAAAGYYGILFEKYITVDMPQDTPTVTPADTQATMDTETPTPTPMFTHTPKPTTTETNDAQYLGDDIPLQMIAGQTYTVHVEMRNTGTRTWSTDPSDDDAFFPLENPFECTHVYLGPGEQVPPGGSTIFEVEMFPGAEDIPGATQVWSMMTTTGEYGEQVERYIQVSMPAVDTETPTATETGTPVATATPSPTYTGSPVPTATLTETPSKTPADTSTPAATWTPAPTNTPQNPTGDDWDAQVIWHNLPPDMPVGATHEAIIEMRNIGNETWDATSGVELQLIDGSLAIPPMGFLPDEEVPTDAVCGFRFIIEAHPDMVPEVTGVWRMTRFGTDPFGEDLLWSILIQEEEPDCDLPLEDYDLDQNGVIDHGDLLILIQGIQTGEPFIDLNCDEMMNARDLLRFSIFWQNQTTP
jgi:predicted outer membrane repeat protein